MRRIVWWGLSTISALVLLFSYSTSTSGPLPVAEPTSVVSGATAGSTSTAGGTTTGTVGGTTTGTTPSAAAAAEVATTVTGSVAQTRWGPVQVELSLAGDTITDVSVLQYPSGNGRDAEINAVALPRLVQETLAAQGDEIDMVSGATYTSEGYLQSLQSALDQAGA